MNYNITADDGKLTINKAPLQITPKDATRKYGEDNPQFELMYDGLKNNEDEPEWTTRPNISTNATKISSVGDYAIEVVAAQARNYDLEIKVGILTITKAPLVVAVENCMRGYGEKNPSFSLYYEGLMNDEITPKWTELPTFTTDADKNSNVGDYTIVATGGEMTNYETEKITPGVLTVSKASLTISAMDYTIKQGEALPEFEATYEGFKNDETSEVLTKKPVFTTTATSASEPGEYEISVSGAEAQNYEITYVDGKLTISEAFIPGDANGDGLVNVTDIVATVNFIMEKPSEGFNKEAADLNGDGVVNVTDIVMMVSIIMDGDN
mgnify:CR=1 FL=1